MLDPGYTHLHDYDRPPIKRPPAPPMLSQINSMPYTNYPAPPAPPCPPKPVKTDTQSAALDRGVRECFIEYMKQRYPRREITYSYTFDRFIDSSIHEMYEAYCAGVVKRVMGNPSTQSNG